jgi:KaiC/GvpD/RAD55 family RecA-like ATPase
MIGEKPLRRLVTGVATLDAIARGGLPEAKVVIVGGAPGAGKTTLSAQLAFDAARAGWAVAIAVNDGPVEDVLQRLAQLDGFTRDEFDARDPDALARIAERFDALGFIVVDTERCRTIEDASELLVAKRGDRPSLLVIDSAQTSTSRNAQLADGPRGKLDATMAALKHCARFDRHLVIAPSELARGAYSSKNAADRIDDLASFKESGGIEYAADLAIVLRNVRGESDLVGVNVAKSRLGSKSPFCLMLDRRHMRFREVDMPSEEERDLAKTAAATSQLEDDTRTVERFLVEHPGVAGKTGLRLAMRAEGHMLGNTRIDVAVERLGTRIEDRGKHKAPSWHLRSVATMPESE